MIYVAFVGLVACVAVPVGYVCYQAGVEVGLERANEILAADDDDLDDEPVRDLDKGDPSRNSP